MANDREANDLYSYALATKNLKGLLAYARQRATAPDAAPSSGFFSSFNKRNKRTIGEANQPSDVAIRYAWGSKNDPVVLLGRLPPGHNAAIKHRPRDEWPQHVYHFLNSILYSLPKLQHPLIMNQPSDLEKMQKLEEVLTRRNQNLESFPLDLISSPFASVLKEGTEVMESVEEIKEDMAEHVREGLAFLASMSSSSL